MKILILSLLIILMFRSVSAAVNSNFLEIEVKYNKKTCKISSFHVTTLDNLRSTSPLVQWMINRENKKQVQCVIRDYQFKCYCDKTEAACWDYNEVMNTVYMIYRNDTNAALPQNVSKSINPFHADYECVLTVLDGLIEHSWSLYNMQTSRRLLSTQVAGFALCHAPTAEFHPDVAITVTPGSLAQEIDRSELKMIVTDICVMLHCQGAVCAGSKELQYLMVKKKMQQQYYSDQMLYECSLPGSACRPDNVKMNFPKYFTSLSAYRNASMSALKDRRVSRNATSTRRKWVPRVRERHVRVGGSIISWIISMIFLFVLLLTIRSVSLYEFPEERKPLNPAYFKLRDVEKVLKKAFQKGSKEQTTQSLQGILDWEAAKKADRKRRKAQKTRVFRSQALSSPRGNSDIESLKKKSSRRKTLQQTQNETDVAVKSDPLKSTIQRPPPLSSAGPRSLQPTQNEITPIVGNGGHISQLPVEAVPRARTPVPRVQTPSNNSEEDTHVYPTRTQSPDDKKNTLGSLEKLEEIQAKRKHSREQQKRRKKASRQGSEEKKKKKKNATSHALLPLAKGSRQQ